MGEKWLAQAAGLLPNLCMATAVCAGPGLASIADMQQACAAQGSDSAGSSSVLERQHLFTLYMHAPPDFPRVSWSLELLQRGCQWLEAVLAAQASSHPLSARMRV